MRLTINDIIPGNEQEFFRMLMDMVENRIRVAIPGVIQSFDPVEQTVTVQPAIQERIRDPQTLEYEWIPLPLLVDVPIVVPRAGGFALTLPVQTGDECILLFNDMSIDSWWQHGGTVNSQISKQRHDLSDAVAILGVWSQPRTLSSYSTSSAELRTEDGTVSVALNSNGITLNGNVTVNGTLTSNSITAQTADIGGIAMTTHVHNAPSGGGTTSGPE